MRILLAGLLPFLIVSSVFAQAHGDIESIGFGRSYRPGCWTPLVVRLTPDTGAAFEGKIVIYQEDIDHDHPVFWRDIALTGNTEGGGQRVQRFGMSFVPQADLTSDGTDGKSVNRKLQVFLCKKDFTPITRLALPESDGLSTVNESAQLDGRRSNKLILMVANESRPNMASLTMSNRSTGLKETIFPVLVPSSSMNYMLPQSSVGYEAVDAVVWADVDPGEMSVETRAAMEQYIRHGGKLIILQSTKPNIWQMVKRGFDNLMPVDVQSIESTESLEPIKRIVDKGLSFAPSAYYDYFFWKHVESPPYDIAIAKPRAGAVVIENTSKTGFEGDGNPWLVRGTFGMGTVSWVAQDLGDFRMTGRLRLDAAPTTKDANLSLSKVDVNYRWTYIWNRVFDWSNSSAPAIPNGMAPDVGAGSPRARHFKAYGNGDAAGYKLSQSFLEAMEFSSTSSAYLGISVLFFLVYWIIAGPGGYLILTRRKQVHKSWFLFAATALAATAVTVLVVRLALRGNDDIHHVSFVISKPGEPTIVHTQFGLYIKRDGSQRIELKGVTPNSGSYISAYPNLNVTDEGPPPMEYKVAADGNMQEVTIPFRSSLKRLRAKWVGEKPMNIEGIASISKESTLQLDGKLTNKTGKNLHNVYFVFRPRFMVVESTEVENQLASDKRDQVLYIADWKIDETKDLAVLFKTKPTLPLDTGNPVARGEIGWQYDITEQSFEGKWYRELNGLNRGAGKSSAGAHFLMLSLFDHLPTVALEPDRHERFEMIRPALRGLDVSGSIGAGHLIVLATSNLETSDEPMPIPVEVEGDKVSGTGTVFYQFILPLDRSKVLPLRPPTTKPTTNSANLPTTDTTALPATNVPAKIE